MKTNQTSALKFLLKIAKQFKYYLFGISFTICCVVADKSIKPFLIKSIIDDITLNDFNSLEIMFVIYAVMQFSMIGVWALFDWCISKTLPQMTSYIVKTMAEKIWSYPYSFFQEHQSGQISNKINDIAKRAPRLIEQSIVELLKLCCFVIISIGLICTVHYLFALALIVWIFIFIMITLRYTHKAIFLSSSEASSYSKVSGMLVDSFTNILSVKIFFSNEHESKVLKSHLDDYVAKSQAKVLYLKGYFSVQGVIFAIYILSCLSYIIYLAKRRVISPGDFALIFMLNFEVVNMLFHLATILNEYMTNWGAMERALELTNKEYELQDQHNSIPLQFGQGEITFDNVQFSYPNADPLFQNKSITIKSGSKVGLVGYSGGGKTTFVNLIMRLYDTVSGRVMIDGMDIRKVTQDSLNNVICMIPQDPILFNRTILENIKYGCFEASEKEVITAAKRAHAHDFINKLPNSYNSIVGERGIKLSGGQRQRIAIARAILKNAPILILDEATSQLDSITEHEIQNSLKDLMHGKTTIVIAHRLSTLLFLDRIMVFDKGKIIEDGSHHELIAKQGLYKRLWDTQVGGFLVVDNIDHSLIYN